MIFMSLKDSFSLDKMSEMLSSQKMVTIGRMFITFSLIWFWLMVTVIAIGGLFGWIFFTLGFVVYFALDYRKKKKATEMREDLVRVHDEGRNAIFDLKVIDGFVVIDVGSVKLVADGTDRQVMRIMIRDLFNIIRTVRKTGSVMDEKLESEMMGMYFYNLGVDTSVARDRVRKDVLAGLNNLYDMGYLSESVLDPELINAVQAQIDSMRGYAYDGNTIKRIMRDVEYKAVKKLHLDSPDVIVEEDRR